MRRLFLIFFTILLSIFLNIPAPIFADDSEIKSLSKIYSERRSGDQMNLETWYGGKSTGNPEESIGFGDIILLDLIEKTSGGSGDTESLNELLESLFSHSPVNNKIHSQDGAIIASGKAITFLYQETPASSVDYIASIKNNLNHHKLAPTAYAQEKVDGFTALEPILPIWRAFRNVSYFIFVLGFIVYGFMIMFRIKINPQTAITIQLALPKLILTLLLITFSYAIAGFLIDIFYLVWGVLFNVLVYGEIIDSQNIQTASNVSGFKSGLFTGPFLGIILHLNFGGLVTNLWQGILGFPSATTAILSHSLLAPFSLLLSLLLSIVVLITFIKIFWSLLKSYVNIILNIIFSPLILLGNLLPGSNSFNNWLKNIFAELSVFATTMLMFILAFYFIGPFQIGGTEFLNTNWFTVNDQQISGNLWAPPPLQSDNAVNSEGKLALLGLGIILMIPKFSEIIKNALQIKDAGYGSAIGDALFLPTTSKAWEKYSTDKASQAISGGISKVSEIPKNLREKREEKKPIDKRLQDHK